jgi:hypothetical protein
MDIDDVYQGNEDGDIDQKTNLDQDSKLENEENEDDEEEANEQEEANDKECDGEESKTEQLGFSKL